MQETVVTRKAFKASFDSALAQAVANEQRREKLAGKSVTPGEALEALKARAELPVREDVAEAAPQEDYFEDFLDAVFRLRNGCGVFEHLPAAAKLDLYCLLESPPAFADWYARRYPSEE